MSEFIEVATTMSDGSALVAALRDLGYSETEWGEWEGWGLALRDEQGVLANKNVELIVRRENTNGGKTDFGFSQSTDKLFSLVCSVEDRQIYSDEWLKQLKQRYSYHLADRLLRQQGFSPVSPAEIQGQFSPTPFQALHIQALKPQNLLGSLLHRIAPNLTEHYMIETLAHNPNLPHAARVLADIVAHYDHQPSRQTALEALEEINNQPCINEVCEVWAASRHPQLAALLIKQGWVASAPPRLKVLTALRLERVDSLDSLNSKDVGLLLQARSDPDMIIAEGADAYLRELKVPALLDALAGIWAETRNPFVWELIQAKQYLPRRSTRTRVLIALKLEMEETVAAGRANVIEPLIEACNDNDLTIAEAARRVLGQLKRKEAQQALCELIIEREIPQIEKIALAAGYLPTEAYKKALFFFVTGQWERYEGLDFDHSLLRTAYQNGEPAFKRRIAEKIRQAGRAEYLKIVAGNDYRSRTAELSQEEAELMVQILTANREWHRLWSLVFEIDLNLSMGVVARLVQADWQPEREDDRVIFEQLKPLVTGERLNQPIRPAQELLPLAVFRARARVVGRVNSIAFSPSRPVIALGTGTGRVILWNMQKAERELVLSGFDHSVGRLAFTREAALVCAERTISESDPCKLYLWPGEGTNLLELGQHLGSVTTLQAVGQTEMLSAGRDGKVRLWDTAERRLKKSLSLDDWTRTACISENGRELALWQAGRVSLVKLPELELAHRLYMGTIGVARSVIYTPDPQALLAGKFGGGLGICLHQENGWRSSSIIPGSLSEITGTVQGLAVVPGRPVVLAATNEGVIHFLEWGKTPRLIGSVQAPTTRLTSLTISPDGAFMAVGDADASFSLWDLRVLELGQLFEQPLASATPRQLGALSAVLESGAELPTSLKNLLRYAQLIVRHRLRFAIELTEEVSSIQAGDFDIEIEG